MAAVTKDLDDLTPEEMAAWRPFAFAATSVVSALDAEMKAAFGISHFDHALLLVLVSAPRRRLRMSDLAHFLGVEPSGVTYRVRNLERGGLVQRIRDQQDRRVTWAVITVKGMRLLRDAWPLHRDGIRRHFLSHVRGQDLSTLATVFESIVRSAGRVQLKSA